MPPIPAFLTLLLTILILPNASHAQGDVSFFEEYNHESRLFRLLMPRGHSTSDQLFRLDDKTIIYASDVFREVQGVENSPNSLYRVRLEQSIAGPFDSRELPGLVAQESQRIMELYGERSPILHEENKGTYNQQPGTEFVIRYIDPDHGELGLRARIIYSDFSRLEITYNGPKALLYSDRVNQFFESARLFDDRVRSEKPLTQAWQAVSPPSNAYQTRLPRIVESYHPFETIVRQNPRVTLVNTRFIDPVRKTQFFYSIYDYRFKVDISQTDADKIIFDRHLKQHGIPAWRNRFKTVERGSDTYREARHEITAPQGYPYINTLLLRYRTGGPHLVVQEFLGQDKALDNSPLVPALMEVMDFTPDAARVSAPDASALPSGPAAQQRKLYVE